MTKCNHEEHEDTKHEASYELNRIVFVCFVVLRALRGCLGASHRSESFRSCQTSPRSCSRSAPVRRSSPSAPTTSSRRKCGRCRPSARSSIPTPRSIIALRPDLVITYGSQTDLQTQLKRVVDSVLRLSPRRPRSHHGDDARARRADGTRRTGGEGGARRCEAASMPSRRRVAGKPRPRTLLVFGREPGSLRNIYASAGRGFLHDMLVAAGGEDVLDDIDKESAQVSTEMILARAPDVIIELNAANRLNDADLKAVDRSVDDAVVRARGQEQARDHPATVPASPCRARASSTASSKWRRRCTRDDRHRIEDPIEDSCQLVHRQGLGVDAAHDQSAVSQRRRRTADHDQRGIRSRRDARGRRELLEAQADGRRPAAARRAAAVAVLERAIRIDHEDRDRRLRRRRLHARRVRRSVSRGRAPVSRGSPRRARASSRSFRSGRPSRPPTSRTT